MDVFQAAFKGDLAKLRAWLTGHPAEIDALSADRKVSLLYTAARAGHLSCVKLLIDTHHADVNLKNGNEDKSTPLHGACYGGHSEVVEFLLVHGAAATAKNGFGETPKENAADPVKGVTKATKTTILAALSKKRKKVVRETPTVDERKKQAVADVQDESNDNSRYYNQVARQRAFASDVARDTHGNVKGAQGDLGNDGAFTGWRLLIFGYVDYGTSSPGAKAQAAISKKGWDTHIVFTEADCVAELQSGTYDLFMLISGQRGDASQRVNLVDAVSAFHNAGHGCLIAADNAPYLVQANWILEAIYGMQLEGNTPGGKNLVPGNPLKKGEYDSSSHMITAGLDAQVCEGFTICYPTEKKLDRSKWEVFGTSTNGHPVLLATTDEYSGASDSKPGRMVIDCGWTKFFDQFFDTSAGTERYLTNALTWLANVEKFQEPVAPNQKGPAAAATQKTKGPVPKKSPAPKKAAPQKKQAVKEKRNRDTEEDE